MDVEATVSVCWCRADSGGFTKEVKRKYDGKIFRLFSAIFELWPIVATIGGRIVVMHGGVPRNPSVTVDMLRDVDTRKQPEDYPRSLQDEMFVDVLWSDPHEGRGIVQGQRGGDAIMFGADIARGFLQRSGMDLLVRSHECPDEYHKGSSESPGFVKHHGGYTYTIFSASNYQGTRGNRGAVMIFDHSLDFEIDEYMAPSLADQARARGGDRGRSQDMRRQSSVVELAREQSAGMDDAVITRLKERIVERHAVITTACKHVLWRCFLLTPVPRCAPGPALLL